jgi:hypothetical protein
VDRGGAEADLTREVVAQVIHDLPTEFLHPSARAADRVVVPRGPGRLEMAVLLAQVGRLDQPLGLQHAERAVDGRQADPRVTEPGLGVDAIGVEVLRRARPLLRGALTQAIILGQGAQARAAELREDLDDLVEEARDDLRRQNVEQKVAR